ncbi:protein lifeguard 1-like [Nymphalis io]|uniref:protein lifeguard 1-like n=1 Tax=Inachis io TaxID=171585 RepID=UPI002166D7BC|nr:protein lifeguard 1-like [Nymphalis io]
MTHMIRDINVVEKTPSLTQNEKEEITIDIEGNPQDLNTNQEILKQMGDDGVVKNTGQTSIHIEKEFKEKSEPNAENHTTFKYGGTERKSPAIWVQYNQAYGQGQGYAQYQGYGQQPNYGGGQNYGGAPMEYDPRSRNYFVKFVFTILFMMLLITAIIGIFINISIVLVAMNYVMALSACARVPPCNFISLIIVVLATSNLVGAITVRYRTHILIFALLATLVTVAVCILLACSSFDFTKWYLYVVVIAVVFVAISMMVSVAMLVMQIRYKPLQIVLLFVGAMINVVILVLELQMILGGRAIEISEDDYAFAAYLLYSSIVDIFLKMVQILGLFDE